MIPKKIAAGIALAAALPLTLTACGGGGSDSGTDPGSTEQVTSLSILDYYNNDPDKQLVQKGLDTCATQLGITINRETVPGDTLIAKVLQQASSKTLPDVLMLDNPDIQQIAATGALAPLGDVRHHRRRHPGGRRRRRPPTTASSTALQPVTNTIAIFYNKDILAKAGVEPPKTWAELKDSAKKLTEGKQYGFAFDGTADYEGAWQFLPAMWTNGGDETALTSPEVAEALQLWKDLVDSGAASKSVVTWSQGDVDDQFMAGRPR